VRVEVFRVEVYRSAANKLVAKKERAAAYLCSGSRFTGWNEGSCVPLETGGWGVMKRLLLQAAQCRRADIVNGNRRARRLWWARTGSDKSP
jgi:hypothetical protein